MMAARCFLGMSVGDTLAPPQAAAAIVTPGPARWYALRVAPQREDEAEAWLRLRGVYGFHPVLMRRAVRHGRRREYARRYLPGYVFARFRGEPVVHRVLACPFILGALCRSGGVWGVLEPARLRQIHAMRRVDAEARARRLAQLRHRQARAQAQAGGAALFVGGAFAGARCEVVEIAADGGAMVRMRLFGGDVLVTAQAGDLVGLHEGD